MSKENRVPKLRFPGFTDDWEQRKLSDVADFNPKSVLPDTFEYVDLESVVGTEMVSHRTENRITAPSRAQRLAKTGDVFFQTVRPYQKNNYLFMKPDTNYVFSTGYAQMRPKINAEFLMCFLQTDDFVQVVLDNCTGTSYPAINSTDLSNLHIVLPVSEAEQEKIGKTIIGLDNLITLHQRKLKHVKEYKEALLNKMFPKDEEKYPKIRFPGFTEDWEQRKFGELYRKSSEKNDGRIGIEKNITVATMQFKNDIKVTNDDYLKTYYTFNKGDIAFEGHQSKEYRFGRFVENDIGDGIVSHIFAVFRPIVDYDLMFWKYAINNENLMQRILSRSTKASTMMHDLVAKDFLEQTFLVPTVDEQKKIGAFFSNFDSLITLHQRKLDHLKQLKKGLLQQMFV